MEGSGEESLSSILSQIPAAAGGLGTRGRDGTGFLKLHPPLLTVTSQLSSSAPGVGQRLWTPEWTYVSHLHRVMVTDGQGLWEDGSERRDPRHLYSRAPEVGSRLAQGHWFSQVNKSSVSRTDTLPLPSRSVHMQLEVKGRNEPGTTELWSRDPATTILQQQT